MKAQFTPGPWVFHETSLFIHGSNGDCVAKIAGESPLEKNTAANLRLIASAPDLLAALEIAEATIQRLAPDGQRATQGTRDVISAAIAKVKGV